MQLDHHAIVHMHEYFVSKSGSKIYIVLQYLGAFSDVLRWLACFLRHAARRPLAPSRPKWRLPVAIGAARSDLAPEPPRFPCGA